MAAGPSMATSTTIISAKSTKPTISNGPIITLTDNAYPATWRAARARRVSGGAGDLTLVRGLLGGTIPDAIRIFLPQTRGKMGAPRRIGTMVLWCTARDEARDRRPQPDDGTDVHVAETFPPL